METSAASNLDENLGISLLPGPWSHPPADIHHERSSLHTQTIKLHISISQNYHVADLTGKINKEETNLFLKKPDFKFDEYR